MFVSSLDWHRDQRQCSGSSYETGWQWRSLLCRGDWRRICKSQRSQSLGTWCQASRTRLRTTAQLFPCLCGRLLLPNKLSLHVELNPKKSSHQLSGFGDCLVSKGFPPSCSLKLMTWLQFIQFCLKIYLLNCVWVCTYVTFKFGRHIYRAREIVQPVRHIPYRPDNVSLVSRESHIKMEGENLSKKLSSDAILMLCHPPAPLH